MDKEHLKRLIQETHALLKGIPEPDRSLSYPIVFSSLLGGALTTKTASNIPHRTVEKDLGEDEEGFKGLTGGMRLLVKEGFFKEQRSQAEIYEELQRQGYTYPRSSLPFTLISFIQKRILTRIKGVDGNWRYAERK